MAGIDEIVYRCGSFPNVPLMGTIGVINYHHILGLRQLGNIYHGEPNKEALTLFIISNMYLETLQTRSS
jgi:hypothetical protein